MWQVLDLLKSVYLNVLELGTFKRFALFLLVVQICSEMTFSWFHGAVLSPSPFHSPLSHEGSSTSPYFCWIQHTFWGWVLCYVSSSGVTGWQGESRFQGLVSIETGCPKQASQRTPCQGPMWNPVFYSITAHHRLVTDLHWYNGWG